MSLPKAVSIVIIVESDGRYLLIQEERGGEAGPVWYFPSGALEPGESLAAAARREALEESGYEIAPISVISIDHGEFREPAGLFWWRFAISARLTAPAQHPTMEVEVVDSEWFTMEQLATLQLRSADATALCEHHQSGNGLALERCCLSEDGMLEGFFV